MTLNAEICQRELDEIGHVPKKYHGQVFTVDEGAISTLVAAAKTLHKPGIKIVEIGGGLGYITAELARSFEDIDVLEIDEKMLSVLNTKFVQSKNVHILSQSIDDYTPPEGEYLLVGNIPFHLSGRIYRRYMSDLKHKPAGMVLITDKQYARTLMGQPPRSYRVSLQAQVYGDIEIVADVSPTSVFPAPKVDMCVMKITRNEKKVPENFWDVVNYHFEHFPTKEVESPKTVGLEGWIKLAAKNKTLLATNKK
jgi:16S rRNA (adenine1518-N6/adenine1519-N6)-dimethyltransferase